MAVFATHFFDQRLKKLGQFYEALGKLVFLGQNIKKISHSKVREWKATTYQMCRRI